MIDWILFITFFMNGLNSDTRLAIDGFSSRQQCEQAYADIKDQTHWSDGMLGSIDNHYCVEIKK